jgi:lipopolysaccharide export system protein LptA
MVLSGDVQFTSPPDEGSTADELVFTTGTFRYDLESGAFNTTGRFDITRGAEYLRAGRMEGEFESGGRNLKSLRAVGKAKLCYRGQEGQEGQEPETAEKADRDLFSLNGYKVINSPVIEFLFSGDEEGSLRGIRTVPRSLMMLYEKAPTGKADMTISAEEFKIDISADTGLIEGFEAEKNVKITQIIRSEEDKEPHEREIKCGRFIAEAADAGGEFDKIYFREGLIIEELDQKIIGKEGIYSSATSRLVIKGNPVLKHTSGASAAEKMEFDISDSALHLSGHVVSKLIDMQSRGNVFRETDELFINAGEMTHYTTTGKSSYKNNVKVYQEKSHMFSDALEIFHSDNSFVATGKVKGRIFRQESKRVKDDNNEPIRFKGGRVEVRESESIMIVENGAEIVGSVKEEIKAEYIEYGFGESFSETRYVKARGSVSFAQSPYSGNSENLLYDYEMKRIQLKGKKVLLYKNGNLVMVARELTFSPSGDIIQSRSIPGERLRAVWKPEEAK